VEFFAVGGATLILLPLLWLLRATLGLDDAALGVSFLAFYGAYLINDPHFAVTYLLFYRQLRQRALGGAFSLVQRCRYWVAGLVVPVGLAVWCISALSARSGFQLGLLIQLMYFLVSWHYVKQGFGALLMLSAKRGHRFAPRERSFLLLHCLAAWLYARATPYDPGTPYLEQGVFFRSLAHPVWLEGVFGSLFALSAAGVTWALWSFRRRTGRFPPHGPFCAYLVSLWLWVVFDAVDPLLVYVIPALHSIQYLYFVRLQRLNQARADEGPPTFGRPARLQLGLLVATSVGLGWLLFHGVPEALDELLVRGGGEAEGPLGPTPYLAALFTFVNIHHYFMDSVIWRREYPETRALLGVPTGT
jgi:hypothetical protein